MKSSCVAQVSTAIEGLSDVFCMMWLMARFVAGHTVCRWERVSGALPQNTHVVGPDM